jgi:hypothetical protein
MRTTRVRWIGALLTCLACGLLVASPTGAFAAQHHHGNAARKKPAHPKGFFVTGLGQVTKRVLPTAFVRDGNGGEHVVTTVPSTSSSTNQGHIDYLTRAPGAKKWKAHLVPGLRPLAGKVQVEEHLSTDGRRIDAIFYECDGVFITDASLSAVRLPDPTQVVAEDNCSDPTVSSNEPPIAQAIPLEGHRIGILLPDPAQDNEAALFEGSTTDTFTAGVALPTVDSFSPQQITLDQRTGEIVVAGTGDDGTNEGIYVTTELEYENHWSTPVEIATLKSPTTDYTLESLTSYGNSKYIGLYRKPTGGVKHSLFVVHGTQSGEWVGAYPLVHTTAQDTALRLTTNVDTGHLHAAWTRFVPSSPAKKSGIMQEQRTDAGWPKPVFLTHWHRDIAQGIQLTASGHPVIGYYQK